MFFRIPAWFLHAYLSHIKMTLKAAYPGAVFSPCFAFLRFFVPVGRNWLRLIWLRRAHITSRLCVEYGNSLLPAVLTCCACFRADWLLYRLWNGCGAHGERRSSHDRVFRRFERGRHAHRHRHYVVSKYVYGTHMYRTCNSFFGKPEI